MLFNALKTISFLTVFIYATPFFVKGIKKQYNSLLKPENSIGILHLISPINNSSPIINQLNFFFKDALIKGIIIKIDCATIALGTSQIIFHDIKHLKKIYPKPIIALIENKCLAGAYLIASACDYIIAAESSIIGNIKDQIDFSSIIKTKENDNDFDNIKSELHQQLVKHIALARRLPLILTHDWANESILTGVRALSLGLIDEIGSFYTTIKIIEKKALIEDDIQWIEYHEANNYLDIFPSN